MKIFDCDLNNCHGIHFAQDISSESTKAMGMPGRNVCNFLLLCNLAMWIIDTFQLQNSNSGAVEAEAEGDGHGACDVAAVRATVCRCEVLDLIDFSLNSLSR